ncbi:GNAT family N-acetyltransferase [Bacteriovorax stolpii]|uniref:GNAT family N-acetyltransferase n=1 Tax=Bacteriovorax stolpii TaxID=960 RepID=UPI001C8F1C74|nr:GNAT family N-acetyltransferase [Bacteriovorax stolpii]
MLTTLKNVTYKPLALKESFTASLVEGLCTISAGEDELVLMLSPGLLKVEQGSRRDNDDLLLVALEYIFGHNPELKTLKVENYVSCDIVLKYFLKGGDIVVDRHQFFQLRTLWHAEHDYAPTLETWTQTGNYAHPVRPYIQSGTLYSRYVPAIKKTLSFRMIDQVKDLDTFHDWHNQPRVANFWELALPKEELLQYIQKGLKDPHTLPMIAECDGVPVGYFEMYWTREDRLAPYYESEAYDRGFHFLIGNPEFLGFQNTDSILKSLSHFLFLDEVRTRKIMAEPRSDNAKVLKYVDTFTAWRKLYEFDFPHKRAALLECKREVFFMGDYL